ncbi:DUF937 domain-containing protein [Saprospiraceae bacterium]|nr:DUF937 domain-containing protein [Saprospiraceae bacterium]
MIKDQVSGSLVSNASKFLGESESGVSKALDGVFPALLGKMISKSEDPNQIGKVFDMVKGADTGILDNIGDLFGGGAGNVAQLMNSGSGALNLLLGNNTGGMIDKVAGFSGLKGSATSSLIKMAAPFLMSIVGKYVKNKALDAVGLGKFLGTQKSVVQSAMPAGLLGSLGAGFLGKGFDAVSGIAGGARDAVTGTAGAVGGAGKKIVGGATGAVGSVAGAASGAGKRVVGGATDAVGNVANAGKSAGGGLMKFLIPLILILGALGVWKSGILSKAADATTEMASDVASGAGDMASKAGDMAGDAAGAVGDAAGKMGDAVGSVFGKVDAAAKGALDKIKFGANSAGSQMMTYIDGGFKGDGKFTFRNLTFASGSAQIDGTSGVEVDNLSAILKAYPDVKVHVAGYTDNTGDAAKNMQLSTQRANAVKARLMGKSIAGNRITTKGMGSADPVASNDTKEGQAQNRRIEVTIVK